MWYWMYQYIYEIIKKWILNWCVQGMNSCTEFDVTTDLPLFTTLRSTLVGKPFLNTQAFDHLTTTNMTLLSCYETFETLIQVLRLTS